MPIGPFFGHQPSGIPTEVRVPDDTQPLRIEAIIGEGVEAPSDWVSYGARRTVGGLFCSECMKKQASPWGVTKHEPGCRAVDFESCVAREAIVVAAHTDDTTRYGVWLRQCGEDVGWSREDRKVTLLSLGEALDLSRHWREEIGRSAEIRAYDPWAVARCNAGRMKKTIHATMVGEYETVAVLTTEPVGEKDIRISVARAWDPSKVIEERLLTPDVINSLTSRIRAYPHGKPMRLNLWHTTETEVELNPRQMRQLHTTLMGGV